VARGERLFKRFGLIGLGERPPARIAGVEQRAVPEDDVPARCPKCGSPHLVMAGRYVSCPGYLGGCGWDAFVVAALTPARCEVRER
jgi:hypothetical protein